MNKSPLKARILVTRNSIDSTIPSFAPIVTWSPIIYCPSNRIKNH